MIVIKIQIPLIYLTLIPPLALSVKRLILLTSWYICRFLNSDDYEGGFNSSDIEQLLSNIGTNYENFASGFASLIADPTNEVTVNKYEKC